MTGFKDFEDFFSRPTEFTSERSPTSMFLPQEAAFNYQPGRNPPEQPITEPLKPVVTQQQSARFIIGFNVGYHQWWRLSDVIEIVWNLRRSQVERAFKEHYAEPQGDGGDIGISFIWQRGLWQPVTDDQMYPENGCQVIILNTIKEWPDAFRQDMEHLALVLARDLQQQAVILEHLENGVMVQSLQYGKPRDEELKEQEVPRATRRLVAR